MGQPRQHPGVSGTHGWLWQGPLCRLWWCWGGVGGARRWLSSFWGIPPPPAHPSALCPAGLGHIHPIPPFVPKAPPPVPLTPRSPPGPYSSPPPPRSSPVNHYPLLVSPLAATPGRQQPSSPSSSLSPVPLLRPFLTCFSRDRSRRPTVLSVGIRVVTSPPPILLPGGSPQPPSHLPLDFMGCTQRRHPHTRGRGLGTTRVPPPTAVPFQFPGWELEFQRGMGWRVPKKGLCVPPPSSCSHPRKHRPVMETLEVSSSQHVFTIHQRMGRCWGGPTFGILRNWGTKMIFSSSLKPGSSGAAPGGGNTRSWGIVS